MTLWQIRTVVDDEPGRLAALAGSLAELGVNILSVQVHPVVHGAVDDFVADAPAELTEEDLVSAIGAGGGRRAVVWPADVHDLADPPTRALQLARRVLSNPQTLPGALAELIDGAAVRWSPSADDSAGDAAAVRVRNPQGGTLVLSRLDAHLTPSEAARAGALAAIAGAIENGPDRTDETDADAPARTRVRWRTLGSSDVPELVELHMRCTAETRTRRYHSAMAVPPRAQLARLINPRRGICLGAEDPDGRIVAFGNLAWPTGFQQVAELGLLVQDDLQGRGMGSELAKRLLIGAIDAELPEVEAYVQPDNLPMLRLLAGLGMPTRRERRDGMLAVSVELPALASQH